MIHELFCVGCFKVNPLAPDTVILKPAMRAISPVVEVSWGIAEVIDTVRRVRPGNEFDASTDEVPFQGVELVDGYLECFSNRLDDESRDFLEMIVREKRCTVIDCLGRVASLDQYFVQ